MQQLDVAGIIHVAHRRCAVDVEDVGFGDVLVISLDVTAGEVLVVAQVDASSINSVGERGVAGEDFVGCHIRIYQLLFGGNHPSGTARSHNCIIMSRSFSLFFVGHLNI